MEHLEEKKMTFLKTKREILRYVFTACANKISKELLKECVDFKELSILQTQLKDKFERLTTYQEEILDELLQIENSEKQFEEDLLEAEEYRDRYFGLNASIKDEMRHSLLPNYANETDIQKRKFKLPKIDLKHLSDAKDYLSFWNQFEKIHLDDNLSAEDKFQYLLQAVVPQSKASKVVDSFPATAENYPKVVEELKKSFGQQDLLVQFYVRELLAIGKKNSALCSTKIDLASLYDELEVKLWALDSLGRTKEKYGDFLTPLVESCLPEDVLTSWKKSRNKINLTGMSDGRTLESLMNFLKQEILGENMVVLVRTVFGINNNNKENELFKESFQDVLSTTALRSQTKQENSAKHFNVSLDNKRIVDPKVNFVKFEKSDYITLNYIKPWSVYGKSVKARRFSPVSLKMPELNEKVSIFVGDITTLMVDAIVNSTDNELSGGGGVDRAIHRAAGSNLSSECATLNGCETGDAKMTWGYNLPSKRIIHTVGPIGENEKVLASCYRKSLKLALINNLRTIAFPCIATGNFGYPNDKAAHVAISIVREVLERRESSFDRIIFCLFFPVDVGIYGVLMKKYFPV